MPEDAAGFMQPQIDAKACNDCNLCRKTCPVNHDPGRTRDQITGRLYPPYVFAAWHFDETIRYESSSGGVFTALAENILARGGAVVGAAFDAHLVVRHVVIENVADLRRLRGSKYVQSEIQSDIYRQIRDLLNRRRYVLFSGTPCQVAGLRGFLQTDAETLLCCDLVCHGVPSPMLFARYVRYHLERGEKLERISFRDKTKGWKNCGIRHYTQDGRQVSLPMFADPYMAAFRCDYSLRPSCYACLYTSVVRVGDLTIGDFWGIAKQYPAYDRDDKGTSLVLVNTTKGRALLDACRPKVFLGPADLDTATAGNPMLVRAAHRPSQRDTFYRDLIKLPFKSVIRKYRLHPPALPRRLISGIKSRLMSAVKRMLRIMGRKGSMTA